MTAVARRMGWLALTVLVPALRAADHVPELPVAEAARFRLAWQDEFDTGSVDETKWNYRSGPAWWSTQQKKNITVTGGVMRIELRKEKAGPMDYTAGGLISKTKFRYGYYEARFRCPPGKGWHTSFWLMGTDRAEQEIDICENDSINPLRYSVNTHRYNPIHTSVGFKTVETPDLSADFHTWGCEFTPRRVTYYFERKVVASFPVDHMAHNDHSIWLTSLAASLGGTDHVDDDKLPAAAVYDYVRFFEPVVPYEPHAYTNLAALPPVSAFGLDELHVRSGLTNTAAKLAATGEVHIAYLGGSITEAKGWRAYTREWLQKQNRKAKLVEIHAAISGSGSEFGACRLQREVLEKKPDLLFVEFAVNDGGTPPDRIIRAMEGIVRQTRAACPGAEICFVYTLSEGDAKTLQAGRLQKSVVAMETVAQHYGIPSIHFGIEVARLEKDRRLQMKGRLPTNDKERDAIRNRIVFSGDGTHPHRETGHLLYLESLARAWPLLATATGTVDRPPAPIDPENWVNASMIPVAQIARSGGWTNLTADAAPVRGTSMDGRIQGRLQQDPPWSAAQAGDALTFRFRGTMVGLYGLKGPDAGNFRVLVDDLPPVEAALFDSYCTPGRWRIKPWFYPRPLAAGDHSVRIELTGTAPAKASQMKSKDAAGYAGTALHVSDILLVGQPLP